MCVLSVVSHTGGLGTETGTARTGTDINFLMNTCNFCTEFKKILLVIFLYCEVKNRRQKFTFT